MQISGKVCLKNGKQSYLHHQNIVVTTQIAILVRRYGSWRGTNRTRLACSFFSFMAGGGWSHSQLCCGFSQLLVKFLNQLCLTIFFSIPVSLLCNTIQPSVSLFNSCLLDNCQVSSAPHDNTFFHVTQLLFSRDIKAVQSWWEDGGS